MLQTTLYPDWKDKIVYGDDGPQPQLLLQTDTVKIILAGLKPGQQIPAHPEASAMYHFLSGNGWMIVDGQRLPVSAGATVTMPADAVRGMQAETELAFIAVRITT